MLKLKTTKKGSDGKENLLVNYSTKSRYAEAYRTLRTSLYFSLMDQELSSLVVTSSVQGEGKTNTVANLAYTIAQAGKRVLMVDADLRKPGLTARFSLKNATGFANLIGDLLGRPVASGKIADYGLTDLLTLTALQNRTCRMTIADLHNEADLLFLRGQLVDIYWKNRPESKKLANTLVREKILTEEEVQLALGHQKKSVRRLGSILLGLGLLQEQELNKVLSRHMMEAFRVTVDMTEGSFTVHTLTEEDLRPTLNSGIPFDQLYQEYISDGEAFSCIRKAIDTAILSTDEKNLYLLPSGSIPPNPSELIGSPRTSYLIKQLKQRFDVLIIDTSPVMPASDALLLSPQVDGVALVVKSGETDRQVVLDTIQQLQKAKANILGVVLNQADLHRDGYYKYYQKYYGN